jgi:hypothetical protein
MLLAGVISNSVIAVGGESGRQAVDFEAIKNQVRDSAARELELIKDISILPGASPGDRKRLESAEKELEMARKIMLQSEVDSTYETFFDFREKTYQNFKEAAKKCDGIRARIKSTSSASAFAMNQRVRELQERIDNPAPFIGPVKTKTDEIISNISQEKAANQYQESIQQYESMRKGKVPISDLSMPLDEALRVIIDYQKQATMQTTVGDKLIQECEKSSMASTEPVPAHPKVVVLSVDTSPSRKKNFDKQFPYRVDSGY